MSLFKRVLIWGALGLVCSSVSLAALAGVASHGLPNVEAISTFVPAQSTKILSEDGIVLAELHQEENREVIPLDQISPYVKKAVVALEDTDFYSHHGVNPKAIARAVIHDIFAMRFAEGGSTLTQQLARNLFLNQKKHMTRKVAEAVLAIQIEKKYTKSEILEMYLNQVYWGHNAYGIESASQQYFGKHARELNLAESAMLVGMLQGPEIYSPFRNFGASKGRQKVALDRMQKLKVITPETAKRAYLQPIVLAPKKIFRYKAPYFTSQIVSQLISMYSEKDVYTSGMKVYTTLNYKWQMKAMQLITDYVQKGKSSTFMIEDEAVNHLNFSQAAMMAIDPNTGYIKVMQGGVDFQENEYNRCTQAKRQPGSAFKPIVYLTALEKGFTPASIVEDTPISFNTPQGVYAPQNYTKKFLGSITLRKALEKSINVVAIKLTHLMGPQNVVRVAHQLGVKSPLSPFISLPLGINDMTMQELISVYGVFASNGKYVEPISILKIEDRNGEVLFKSTIKDKQVFDSNLISTLVDMMRGALISGTGTAARIDRPAAGKTGTTSDYKDAWFFGFVPQLVCAVWVGNDNNASMNKVTGGTVPAMMWKEFMTEALAGMPVEEFPKPGGISLKKEEVSPEQTGPKQNWESASSRTESKIPTPSRKEKTDEDRILDFFKKQP